MQWNFLITWSLFYAGTSHLFTTTKRFDPSLLVAVGFPGLVYFYAVTLFIWNPEEMELFQNLLPGAIHSLLLLYILLRLAMLHGLKPAGTWIQGMLVSAAGITFVAFFLKTQGELSPTPGGVILASFFDLYHSLAFFWPLLLVGGVYLLLIAASLLKGRGLLPSRSLNQFWMKIFPLT